MAVHARLVLVVSGLNEISADFHNFPANPVGIITVKHRASKTTLFSPNEKCKTYCQKHGLQFATVTRSQITDVKKFLHQWSADLVVTHSVPILPMHVINDLSCGAINLHHSKLPAYRGGNPLLWQVMDGVSDIGVSVHRLSERADEGDVFAQLTFERPGAVSKGYLAKRANKTQGLPLLKTEITNYLEGNLQAKPQTLDSPTDAANHFALENLLGVLSQVQQCPRCHQGYAESSYCFHAVGVPLHLLHADGCIVFAPKLSLQTLLAKILLRQ